MINRSRLKSVFYKSNLENPSAFKISPNGPHICALDARKYAAHLGKFWRQMDFPCYFYKKWTLVNYRRIWLGILISIFHIEINLHKNWINHRHFFTKDFDKYLLLTKNFPWQLTSPLTITRTSTASARAHARIE